MRGNYVIRVPRPGLMSVMLSDSLWHNVHNLTIKGTINKKDVDFLSELLAGRCELRQLNMQETNGVEHFSLHVKKHQRNRKSVNENLVVFYLPQGIKRLENYALGGYSALEQIVLPVSLETIGNKVFENCASLESITLPTGIKEIGDFPFYGCSQLEEINCEGTYFEDSQGILYSTKENTLVAYPVGSTQTKFNVPKWVENIRKGAFASSVFLQELHMPDGLKTFGDSAFADCFRLSVVDIPGSVAYFGAASFVQDTSLMTVKVHEGVKEIGESSFVNCFELNQVSLPSTVEKIGDYAFYGCASIERFINNAVVPQNLRPHTFPKKFNGAGLGNLIVKEEAVESYKKSAVWNRFNTVSGK